MARKIKKKKETALERKERKAQERLKAAASVDLDGIWNSPINDPLAKRDLDLVAPTRKKIR